MPDWIYKGKNTLRWNEEWQMILISVLLWIGSPFLCRVNDGGSDVGGSGMSYGSGNSKVTLDLEHLGLIPVAVPSHFTIRVAGGDDAELAVSVQGKYMYWGFMSSEFIVLACIYAESTR